MCVMHFAQSQYVYMCVILYIIPSILLDICALYYNQVKKHENRSQEDKKMTDLKNLGLMATQYEKFGEITETEIIEAYIDEELEIDIDLLADYNEYLNENGYETYFADLDEVLAGYRPLEIIQKTYFGKFSYADDYFKFNGYANIDSFSEYQVVEEMKSDREFLRWYIEENCLIDEDEMQEAIEYGNEFLSQGW
nr:MAG TPA: hypothetical protein [Bacteriophage sp.]